MHASSARPTGGGGRARPQPVLPCLRTIASARKCESPHPDRTRRQRGASGSPHQPTPPPGAGSPHVRARRHRYDRRRPRSDRRRLPGDPRERPPDLRGLSRRVLARSRNACRVSRCVRAGADRGRLPRGADSRRVRRRRPAAARRRRDPRGHPRGGLQRRGLPRADVHHGHAAAARQRRAEGALPARHRERRAAAAGVRRDRADIGHRHHAVEDARGSRRRRLRAARAEGVDVAGAPLRPHARARAHDAARPGAQEDRRPVGVPARHPRVPGATGSRSRRCRR